MFASKDTLLTRPSGYNIARSVRTRSSASGYFNRTLTTPTNNKIWTWSAWVKRGILGTQQFLLNADNGSANSAAIDFLSDAVRIYFVGGTYQVTTTQVFRDPSAWYHIIFAVDTTQATASNRVKVYVNGSQVTSLATAVYPTQNLNGAINSAVIHTIAYNGVSLYFDGYLTEVNFVDGQQLTPSSFGSTNTSTGVWQPAKYTGTYGTNGFYLNFSDNSSNTATTIGKDYSGNGNNWTPNNISVTSGVTYDSMVDSPTVGSLSSNYAVMNPVAMTSNVSATNGNLTTSFTSLNNAAIYGTFMLPTSGKWYFESIITTVNTASSQDAGFGIVDATTTLSNISAQTFSNGVIYRNRGDFDSRLVVNGSSVVSGNTYSWSNSDVVQIAYDADSGKVWVGRNNSWFDTSGGTTGNPSSGTNQIGTLTTTINMLPVARAYSNTLVMNWNFGQQPFTYTPPTGFVALNTYNLPASTITNGAAYMAATLYTGTGASLTVANTVGSTSFQPDWVWVKSRSAATDHALYDSVRGVQKQLESNTTTAETTETTGLTAFGSTGFTVGALAQMNTSSATYVAWQWLAGTTSASNTNGSITSTVSVGATQGFSVVTYTGNGSSSATVGHGLGAVPSMMIVKLRSAINSWAVYHSSIGTNYLLLNATNASASASTIWNAAPTSSVFTVGSDAIVNTNGGTFVAYCFAAVAGYSAFGSYTGNGSTDGAFIYTGFRPRWVLIKNSGQANDWFVMDSSMNTYNVIGEYLYPNSSAASATNSWIDFLSNGFKIRSTATGNNNSSIVQIYAAFAEVPFKSALGR